MSNLEIAAILSDKVYENLARVNPNTPVTFGANGRYEVLAETESSQTQKKFIKVLSRFLILFIQKKMQRPHFRQSF